LTVTAQTPVLRDYDASQAAAVRRLLSARSMHDGAFVAEVAIAPDGPPPDLDIKAILTAWVKESCIGVSLIKATEVLRPDAWNSLTVVDPDAPISSTAITDCSAFSWYLRAPI